MFQTNKTYDLEERTYKFAKEVGLFSKKVPRDIANIEYLSQLVRSSSSPGANYIEANEAISKKDFVLRIKISKKECKETIYWLRLLNFDLKDLEQERLKFIKEAQELMNIFGAILIKCQ